MNRLIDYISRLVDSDRYLFVVAFALALIIGGVLDMFIPFVPVNLISVLAGLFLIVWVVGRKVIARKFKIW
jgi:Flp pilus assembly protein TadB